MCNEVAKRRLENMNQKLRDLEKQMEVLEAEMNKANDYERMMVVDTPRPFGIGYGGPHNSQAAYHESESRAPFVS
ncbi:hypothetical protein ACLOJK_010571 [Asimina triloba]